MEHLLHQIAAVAEQNHWNLFGYSVMDGNGASQTIHPVQTSACCNCYSVAKLFTLTALGLLYDQGLLDWNERIVDLFPDAFPANADPHWNDVTIDHVVRHRMGLDEGYLDIDTEDIFSYPSDDFLRLVFSRRLPFVPGTQRTYSDAAYYLLSRIVTQKTGEALDTFLWRHLFYPLHVQEAAWSKCPRGYAIGATGLYLRTEDVVKLGHLYQNGGRWNDRQILSPEFVSHAVQNRYEWMPLKGTDCYGKRGMNGQILLFSPAHHLSVAWHSFTSPDVQKELLRLTIENLPSC